MGQQQLLLLVIGIILVGFAVVAGISAVQKYTRQDEADGLLDRSLAIATQAVYWKTKNDPYAGGNQSYAALATNGMAMLALDTTTVRGRFAITGAWQDSVQISAISTRYPDIGVRVTVEEYDIKRTVISYDSTITLN